MGYIIRWGVRAHVVGSQVETSGVSVVWRRGDNGNWSSRNNCRSSSDDHAGDEGPHGELVLRM